MAKKSTRRAALLSAAAAAAAAGMVGSTPAPSSARPDGDYVGPHHATLTLMVGGKPVPQTGRPELPTIKSEQARQRANAKAGRFVGQGSWDEGDTSAPSTAVPAGGADSGPKG